MDRYMWESERDMNDTLNRIKKILIVQSLIWLVILGIFMQVWAFALPIFYIITVLKKKQYAYSTAIYILSIISILVLVFLLIGIGYSMIDSIASGEIADEYMDQLPMMIATALMAVSLVLNTKLVLFSGAVRKERWLSSGWQPNSPDNNRKRPTHVASLIIGIVSVISFFGFVFMGIPCIICGIIGIVLSNKAKADYNSNSGGTLSTIGLLIGIGLLAGSIGIRVFN